MLLSDIVAEPYVVSAHFYSSLEKKAAHLEAAAARDERFAAILEHPDHKRRHRQLVQLQLEQAALLREFLADVKVRTNT